MKNDLNEIQRAVEDIAKLSGKASTDNHLHQILSLSEQVRKQARGTSGKIRSVLGKAPQDSTDFTAFSQLGEQLKETLGEFTKHMAHEATSSSTKPLESEAPHPQGTAATAELVPWEGI